MRKFTLSVLVLVVSVFFLGQSALGQGMFSKTADIIKSTSPIVTATKSVEALEMADMYSIDFEAEVAWTFDFMPWTVVDVDLQPTWGIDGHTFPHSGEAMAFIVFDPATVDPSMADDPEIQPHSGTQLGVCMASMPDPDGNDDWFISDMLSLGDGANFNFWAKSYTDQYGLERFNVAVSTTTPDPAEFTVISGSTYVEAPIVWTEYIYDLSAYAGQDVYVAIQCVTNDAFIFMIDDLVVDPGATGGPVCEDFDALTVGDLVAEQLGSPWNTWSGTSADDATVSDMYSNSPDNSFVVDAGAVDLIYEFGAEPIATGQWLYSHYIYVPTGYSGYFNVQTDPTPGVAWNLDLYFDDGGDGHFDGQSSETFTYVQDTWIFVEINYDLDVGMGEVYFDGVMMLEFVNELTIGGIDYYGSDSGGDPGAYYDDVCFGPGWEISLADCENFDALTVGDLVAEQLGSPWNTWSGTSADDATVSDMYSNSPDNSFVVDAGTVDLIYEFDTVPIETGQWLYSHYIYVPTGYSGYFNVQTDPTPGVAWNLDLYFDDGGDGHFDGQSSETFTYVQDTWIFVEINYDLDVGMGEVYFDGVMMLEFVNELTIGGIDYYGSDSGGDPGAYYDDVCFGPGWEISLADCENFDALTVGDLVAEQLGSPWNTWSGTSADDATVSDMYSNSPSNSFVVDAGTVDLIYEFDTVPIETGQWLYSNYIYVPTGYSGYFNVQTDPTPGVAWNLDLYFDDGGDGHFDGQSSETFTYVQDTWIFVEINYDLDAGLGQVYFDGVLVLEFVNELTIGGIDYYGADTGGDPGAYYDDVCFGPGWEIVSIDDNESFVESNTTIFPNPATDRVTIRSNNIIDEVLIYNNMGQLVFTGPVNDDQIMVNTSTFVTGMYIVQVKTGTAVEVRKLIIE